MDIEQALEELPVKRRAGLALRLLGQVAHDAKGQTGERLGRRRARSSWRNVAMEKNASRTTSVMAKALLGEKLAFTVLDALSTMGAGAVAGYQTGRPLSAQTAAFVAPTGRKIRSEETARAASFLPVVAGSLIGAALLKGNPRIRAKAMELAKRVGIQRDEAEMLAYYGLPLLGGAAGGSAAGVGTGLAVGGVARLRGPKPDGKGSKS